MMNFLYISFKKLLGNGRAFRLIAPNIDAVVKSFLFVFENLVRIFYRIAFLPFPYQDSYATKTEKENDVANFEKQFNVFTSETDLERRSKNIEMQWALIGSQGFGSLERKLNEAGLNLKVKENLPNEDLVAKELLEYGNIGYGALRSMGVAIWDDDDYANFDGVNDYISFLNPVFTTPQIEFTFSVRINANSFNGGGAVNISSGIFSNWNRWRPDSQEGFSLSTYYSAADNEIHFQFSICDGTNYAYAFAGHMDYQDFLDLFMGVDLHIVGTFKANEAIRIYINGEQVNSYSTSYTSMSPDLSGATYIGRTDINQGYFNGRIWDVRVFDKAFTEAEVVDLYGKENLMVAESNLKGWWVMREGTGGVINDASISENNGTVINADVGFITQYGSSGYKAIGNGTLQYLDKNEDPVVLNICKYCFVIESSANGEPAQLTDKQFQTLEEILLRVKPLQMVCLLNARLV